MGTSIDAPRVAIVHDWLVSFAGSERVVQVLAELYPSATIFTSVYDVKRLRGIFPEDRVRPSFLQGIPFAIRQYQNLLPLMPMAFECLDLSEFDLVISSSHACSKGVITRPDAVHVCYCHTPMRYAWSHFHEYVGGMRNPIKRALARFIMSRLRVWDFLAAQRVDYFVANSREVQRRIAKYYRRQSVVIHPPVGNATVRDLIDSSDYYLSLGRLVPYKRVDLAVQACVQMGKRLLVVGDGPEIQRLKQMAGETVEFLGEVSEEEKYQLLSRAKALLFCPEEDFGIVPVEAQQCGVPVIAFGRGGSEDTVLDGETGVLFHDQTVGAVIDAIIRFEMTTFDRNVIAKKAAGFSPERFRTDWTSFVSTIGYDNTAEVL